MHFYLQTLNYNENGKNGGDWSKKNWSDEANQKSLNRGNGLKIPRPIGIEESLLLNLQY